MKKSRIVSSIWLILILQSAILMAETFEIPGEGKFRHIIIDGKSTGFFRQVHSGDEASRRIREKQAEVGRTFQHWIDYLHKNRNDPGLVREALERLGYADGPNIELALKAARDILDKAPEDETGPAAIVMIKTLIQTSQMDDSDAYKNILYLKSLLTSASHPVRIQAAISLVSFGEKDDNRKVLLNSYNDQKFRRSPSNLACLDCVAWALGEIGGPDESAALTEALSYNDLPDDRKITIAGTLARMGKENTAADALDRIARSSPDKWTRIRALETLGKFAGRNSRAMESIRRAQTQDSDRRVRDTAGKILKRSRDSGK
jgi:tetratricopeptide (TPR) repeat protein